MTFDQSIGLWCVGAPAAAMIVGAVMSRLLPDRLCSMAIALGWFAAVAAAMFARQGFAWWPEDAWRQSLWPFLGWALVVPPLVDLGCVTRRQGDKELEAEETEVPRTNAGDKSVLRWVLVGSLACLTAMLAMPSGESWSDTLPLQRTWMGLVIVSVLWNAFGLEWMVRNGAHRWCLLVAVAGLGAPFVLAAATYGSLAELALAMTVAAIVAAVAGLVGWSPMAWVAMYPIVAGTAVVTASARFYTYQEYPAWVYAIALLIPITLASVDACLRSRPTWLRVTVSAVVAIGLIGACVWKVLLSDPF